LPIGEADTLRALPAQPAHLADHIGEDVTGDCPDDLGSHRVGVWHVFGLVDPVHDGEACAFSIPDIEPAVDPKNEAITPAVGEVRLELAALVVVGVIDAALRWRPEPVHGVTIKLDGEAEHVVRISYAQDFGEVRAGERVWNQSIPEPPDLVVLVNPIGNGIE